MNLLRLLLPVLLFSCGFDALAQDSVTIKLNVTDSYTKAFLAGVSVVNPTAQLNLATDARGNISFKTAKQDILFLFYPGYRVAKFSVADSAQQSEYHLKVALEPLSTGLDRPVIIKAPRTLEQIEEDRKKLGITPKELERPIISPFTSPISAIYEILSRRAQEREKLKKQIEADDRRKIFKELLAFYNENGLIDLPEEHYDNFIDYCNLPTDFLKYNSDYEITRTIVGLYNKYGRLNGIIK